MAPGCYPFRGCFGAILWRYPLVDGETWARRSPLLPIHQHLHSSPWAAILLTSTCGWNHFFASERDSTFLPKVAKILLPQQPLVTVLKENFLMIYVIVSHQKYCKILLTYFIRIRFLPTTRQILISCPTILTGFFNHSRRNFNDLSQNFSFDGKMIN